MKIVFNVKEDDARNPGVIADCTGDNAGDSVGPTADGFETYGVTGVALITFILMGVRILGIDGKLDPAATNRVQGLLLVWIFAMRLMMVISSGASKFILSALPYLAFAIASFTKYERPLATIIMMRITKIQTSSCTCTLGSWTASRMNEMSATPVTP